MKNTINNRNKKYIYTIKDLEGNELANGKKMTINEVCDFIGCNKSSISSALNEGRNLIKKKYLVNRYSMDDYYEKEKRDNKQKKKQTQFEKEVELVRWHLDIYGNTIVWKNPKRIIEQLEKQGYETSVEHREPRIVRYFTPDGKVNDNLDERWIITLIKKGE